MARVIAALVGAALGAVVGFFAGTAAVGMLGGNGQAPIAGLVWGVPAGLAVGAVAGWLLARRPGRTPAG